MEKVDKLESVLEGEDWDLILLDIMMAPKRVFSVSNSRSGIITGKLAFQEIIKKCAPKTPVIVLTALSERTELGEETRKEMEKDRQVADYLFKPVTGSELKESIKAALGDGD